MVVYYDERLTYAEPRLFPYTAGSPDHAGYIDFKSRPELIPTSLEDFKHRNHLPAIQKFYSFLEWVNGKDSHLETNDSALRGPRANSDPNSNLALEIDGRVVLIYRDLALNCSAQHSDWLCGKLMQILHNTDPNFISREGVVGFTLNPELYLAISKANPILHGFYDFAADDPGLGKQLMLSFWAYGNSEAELYQNLERVFGNIWTACRNLSYEIEAGL